MLETLARRRALLCGGLHLAQSAISSNVCWGLSVKECLLYSPKRTYVTTTGMSALCQKQTSRLFDYLVRNGKNARRHGQSK